MRKSNVIRIDGAKLKEKLESRGHLSVLSEEMGYSRSYLGVTCKNNKITPYGATLIEKMFGIKFEEYKYEEPQPEPEPKPEPETKIVTKDECFMKSVLSMLAEICNNQRIMNSKLDELIRLWGAC